MKRTILTLLVACLVFCCASCAAKPKTLDIDKLSSELLSSGVFAEKLEPLDNSAVSHFYGISKDDCDRVLVYCSSGATSDELALFQAKDSAAAARMAEAAAARVKSQITAFKNYVPAAVPKLEKAITVTYGNYVILCVATDTDGANKIINNYIPNRR